LALVFAWGAIGFASGATAADDRPVVLFLGDSLTAGYGLAAEQAFPALIQQRIDAASLGYRVVNAGVSGDTSAGGLRRVNWLLRQPIAVLVLALGGNDMLRGQGVDAMASNLRGILDRVDAARPGTRFVIAGMRAAPNLGARYAQAFEAAYVSIAADYEVPLIPFLLDGVAANRALNQPDGIHPTAAGQRVVAATVWKALAPVLAEAEDGPDAETSTGVPSDAPMTREAR
jgi:acyl-CoA thioesterase-1